MSLNIVRIAASEISDLQQILVECGLDSQKRFNLSYWVPPYPLDKMVKDAEIMNVYAVKLNAELISLKINMKMLPYLKNY